MFCSLAPATSLVLLGALLSPTSGKYEVGYENPACDGKTVIVHLFEWRWEDIALECERFLAPAGFCGVQVGIYVYPLNDRLESFSLRISYFWPK